MFLDLITRRNPGLIDVAITLHQQGLLPANTYVFDLDAVAANAAGIASETDRHGLDVFAMTKQVGRNPDLCRVLTGNGISRTVAVDMACARGAVGRGGMSLGHIGHLVQVPRFEAAEAASMAPENWTVLSLDKAREAGAAAASIGRTQSITARIHAPGDRFYPGHEGGFAAAEIVAIADQIDEIPGATFGGITTFPAQLFDPATGTVRPTPNLTTLEKAAAALSAAGRTNIRVNAPGTTSAVTFAQLAAAGATQVEPGHALTGTTPLHAVTDALELPAAVYLSEVSHQAVGRTFCFGGGLYVDPVIEPYQVTAVVGSAPDATVRVPAHLPDTAAIDYYAQLDTASAPQVRTGDSVVFGFRIQAFVTRAFTAGVAGIASGNPVVQGLWFADGSPATIAQPTTSYSAATSGANS